MMSTKEYHQGRHGRFLKDAIAATTSTACRRCHCTAFLYFSKSSQGPSLGCFASPGGPEQEVAQIKEADILSLSKYLVTTCYHFKGLGY